MATSSFSDDHSAARARKGGNQLATFLFSKQQSRAEGGVKSGVEFRYITPG